ncbi:Gfo/Idh/MocA family protein [Rossellomorea aquimaris]|uniref:Oxidoreductase n=1 Tax=Rossellomorea aquimaris TaxID=189382 RepID=A0A1J6VZE7_9BACI|nr:Gfo/Idh/MocA family oxidoreductase [Rossellomorea aquimaris]OIU69724.1 oxidoreductase [Rossellomorea aquimaris]
MKDLNIGMVGLDTSHASVFTRLLNDSGGEHHVPGGKVIKAFPGGSPDFELSVSRIGRITEEVRRHGVEIVDTLEETAEGTDAVLLESVDGSTHLEQLRRLIVYRKPIFIDKPFSLSSSEAEEMAALASTYSTPIVSTSALRFSEGLRDVLSRKDKGAIIGADCFGPMDMIAGQGYFWYGIHAVEMLFAILGEGTEAVTVNCNDDHDLIVGRWRDGRIGTVRGNRSGCQQFGALVHFEKGTEYVNVAADAKPFYASLLEEIIRFFQGGSPGVKLSETLEIIRFIESAGVSRVSGERVDIE